ncbi:MULTISPECIES: ABC transporter permease [Streptomyces]|uniref:Transport permease protein n=1 Tax=Streptomyces badius TaxID=1941 RepID=A0ABQ2TMJ6_STRBA|nr:MULTISPECIES: ABC transporter permease [Streptomyces]GGS78291.1 transport permease protein [Streptomyces badius]
MTAPTVSPAPTRPAGSAWRGTSYQRQILVLTGRSLTAMLKNPQLVAFSLLQPLIMLILFSQVFGTVLESSTLFPEDVSYINYLMPAILIMTGIGASLQSGMGLINDMRNGVLARFRSLPIRASSVLVARSLSDLIRTGTQLALLLLFAVLLFGFEPGGGLLGTLGAALLGLAVSWALTWVFLAFAAWLRNSEVMQAVGFLIMFPLMFASSAYVPLDGLPGWLQLVAHVNPLTYAIDAARALSLGNPVGSDVLLALATSAAVLAVSAFAAVRGFRRPLQAR